MFNFSSSLSASFSPSFLLMRVQLHVVCVVLHHELHVLSCERALPEDGASSTDTVSFKGFAKPLKKCLVPVKGSTRFLRLPHPPFPFENILFHWAISCLSPCVISSFSIQTPPPLLANICVVTGGEILEPVVYFRIKKTSSMPTLLPSYVHTHTQLCLFLVKFSRASLCHKRQQMPLSPYQIRAGQKAGVEGNWGQGQTHVSGPGGQPQPAWHQQ